MNFTSTLAPENNESFPALYAFHRWYWNQHGYVSLVVCTVGILSNIVNIVVLVQKHMVSPTNTLLVGIALADLSTMAVYVPYAVHYYLQSDRTLEFHPYGWVTYLVISNALILTFHTVSLWLTVSLAVFRYIVVCHYVHAPRLCNLSRARMTIVIVTIISVVICIPNYLNYKITLKTHKKGIPFYWFGDSYINVVTRRVWFKLTLWLYAAFFKIAPSILLVVLSSLLIRAMNSAKKRRRRLLSTRVRIENENSREYNRTTTMLVMVVMFFAITEMPQGVLAFWSLLDMQFFQDYYVMLGDVFDVLVLINSSVNFILYCVMSNQFRVTFTALFLKRLFHIQPTVRKSAPNETEYSAIEPNEETLL